MKDHLPRLVAMALAVFLSIGVYLSEWDPVSLLTGQLRTMSLAHIATESPLAARSEYAVFSLGMGLDADVVAIFIDHIASAAQIDQRVSFHGPRTFLTACPYRSIVPVRRIFF